MTHPSGEHLLLIALHANKRLQVQTIGIILDHKITLLTKFHEEVKLQNLKQNSGWYLPNYIKPLQQKKYDLEERQKLHIVTIKFKHFFQFLYFNKNASYCYRFLLN